MKETAASEGKSASSTGEGNGVEGRIFRTMAAAVALAVIVSVPFAAWRVTTGLLVGGLLSLLNYHWMRTSISAAFDHALSREAKPTIKMARYFLRYCVVAAIVFAAYKLNIVSLPATVAGLCSFVAALFVEAFREFYLAFIHREEIR